MRLVGHGHPAIRATHAKTLEFSADQDITGRATCVVAVGVRVTDDRRLAGPVRITLSAGGESFAFRALANPSWQPDGTAVVRRSGVRLPGTLATEAAATAGDLPRPLVAALQDPAATVEVLVEPVPGPPTAVLLALDPDAPADPRLAAELLAADVVVAEDDQAARLLGEGVGHGPVAVAGRVLAVACRELPGATVAAALRQVELDTVGLPAPLAAAAASPSRGPLVLAGAGQDPRELLRRTPSDARLVVRAPADQLPGLLRLAGTTRGTSGAVVVAELSRPRRVDADSELAGREPVHVCFDAAPAATALDPAVRAAVAGLLADGVPTKTVASTLATLSGWDRRRAYDAVLHWPPL